MVTRSDSPVICPRQADATLSDQLGHRPHWRTDHWSQRRIWSDWFRDQKSRFLDRLDRLEQRTGRRLLPRNRTRFYGGTKWPSGEPKPRTCSYCGGVHPDDAILLLARGWDVEATDKSYKRYLHPPGYRAAMDRMREQFTFEIPAVEFPESPVPPVKVYTYHFEQAQIDAFNHQLDIRNGKATAS